MFQRKRDNRIINQVKLQKTIKNLGVHKMKKFFEQFLDKKFIAALVAMIAGILGLLNYEDSVIALISNIIMIAIPAVAYVITTGVLDWNKVNTAIKEILNIIEIYMDSEEAKDTEEAIGAASRNNKEKQVIYKIADILKTVVRK